MKFPNAEGFVFRALPGVSCAWFRVRQGPPSWTWRLSSELARLNREFERARIESYPLLVIGLDVYDFKKYNDVHGHLHGGFLMRSLAEPLKQCLCDTDIMVRRGGEGLVIVYPRCPAGRTQELVEGLCRIVAGHPFDGRET